jgi:hypothetical protein
VDDSWKAVFGTHYEALDVTPGYTNINGLTPANFQNDGAPEGGLLALEEQAETGLPLDQAVNSSTTPQALCYRRSVACERDLIPRDGMLD